MGGVGGVEGVGGVGGGRFWFVGLLVWIDLLVVCCMMICWVKWGWAYLGSLCIICVCVVLYIGCLPMVCGRGNRCFCLLDWGHE